MSLIERIEQAEGPSVVLIEPHFDARGNSNYTPCDIGLHLCGIAVDPRDETEYEQPYTALNLPARNDDEARAMFEAAKAEAALPDREGEDFILDLNLRDGCVDDFSTNRQLLPRLVKAALAAAALKAKEADNASDQD